MRMTISIPDDLKLRMDRLSKRVNWSAVARSAFEARVAELTAKQRENDMESVIQRLRASKVKTREGYFSTGFPYGKHWAKRIAETIELERIEAALQDAPGDELFSDDDHTAYTPGERLGFIIDPELSGSRTQARNFWQDALVEDDSEDIDLIDDASFVNGFVAGAMEVWDEVSPHL